MSTDEMSLYSDYDTESNPPCRLRAWSTRNCYKKRYRREIKIEISELLIKFSEYSRYGAKLSCKYVSHPTTCGLIVYVPYLRPKYKTGSLTLDIERNWELGAKRTNKYHYRQIVPDTVYFRMRNAKLDVSYARMVKKPPILNTHVDKEEMWGSRYPRKRYIMNEMIRYQLTIILSVLTERLKSYFTNVAVDVELFNTLLFGLRSILESVNMNQFPTLQHVLNELGKFFLDSRLMLMNRPELQRHISRLEIEFENQLEIRFGEWNTK